MDESVHFGVLLCSDITSDAVLKWCLGEISRRMEPRFSFDLRISDNIVRRIRIPKLIAVWNATWIRFGKR